MAHTLPQPGGGSLELAIELDRLHGLLCDQGDALAGLAREHAAMAKMLGLRGSPPSPADSAEGIPEGYDDPVARRVRARRRRMAGAGLRAVR